jgi:hypothetical protein
MFLILVSIAFLSFFHWLFFWWRGITDRYVRMIDYPYLLVGLCAAFLFAYQQQKDRALAFARYDDWMIPATKTDLLAELDRWAVDHYCRDKSGDRSCQWFDQVRKFLAAEFTEQELAAQIASGSRLAEDEGWNRVSLLPDRECAWPGFVDL